jgi:hypothetical protein
MYMREWGGGGQGGCGLRSAQATGSTPLRSLCPTVESLNYNTLTFFLVSSEPEAAGKTSTLEGRQPLKKRRFLSSVWIIFMCIEYKAFWWTTTHRAKDEMDTWIYNAYVKDTYKKYNYAQDWLVCLESLVKRVKNMIDSLFKSVRLTYLSVYVSSISSPRLSLFIINNMLRGERSCPNREGEVETVYPKWMSH